MEFILSIGFNGLNRIEFHKIEYQPVKLHTNLV